MRALLAGLVGLAGCGSSPTAPVDACTPPPSPATFELGTGEQCFARLTAGQTLPVNQGPQGGFHLWAALGCTDCGPSPIVEYGVKNVATGAWYSGNAVKQVVDLGGAWPQHAGLIARLPGDTMFNSDLDLSKGTHVILSLGVVLKGGDVLHTEDTEVVLGDTVLWSACDPSTACGQAGASPCCPR